MSKENDKSKALQGVCSTDLLASLDQLWFQEHSKAKYKEGVEFDKHELIATGIARARNHVAEWIANAKAHKTEATKKES